MSELRAIRRLLAAAERRTAVVLLALMVTGSLLETLCAGLVLPAIAVLMQQDIPTTYPQLRPALDALGNPGPAALMLTVVLGLVAIYLVKNLFLAYLTWRQMRFVFAVHSRLSQQLFSLYLRQPYTFHLQRNSGQLVRNVISEVGLLADTLIHSLSLATEALALAGISALLLAVEPIGTLTSVLVLGIAAGLSYRGTRERVAAWGKARQVHERLRFHHVQQGLAGAKEVKLLGREKDFLEQYGRHTAQTLRAWRWQTTLPLLNRLWLEFLAVVGLAVLAIVMLTQGRPLPSIVPTLGLFAVAAFRLLPAVDRIANAVHSLRFRSPVIHTLREEFELASAEPAATATRQRITFADLQLQRVSFSYPGAAAPALCDVTLRVAKGECVGFVGPSGAGKSTLVDVVLGVLEPQSGSVTVDGKDVHEDLRGWQDQIGYVPQSVYLTDDTLRRNVALGLADDEIDDEAVRRAVREAQLDDFVAGLPHGLDTIVGERGVRISGGQRQRIAIARALYHDPAVLVLDEATSALDTATEAGVMRAVAALRGAKTFLIVAHRLSTVAGCDRLYRLENGRVVSESANAGPRAAAGRE